MPDIRNQVPQVENSESRVSVYFDLDVESLKRIYEPMSGHNYTNAYHEIRSFMKKEGYEHEQGSVYHSVGEKDRSEVIRTIQGLQDEKSWLKECVKKMSYARISEEHDLTGVLQDMGELSRNGLERKPELKDIFDKQRTEGQRAARKPKRINLDR